MKKEELKKVILDSGYKRSFIANEIGMDIRTLNSRISGKTKFTCDEALAVKKVLKMTNSDFLKIFVLD